MERQRQFERFETEVVSKRDRGSYSLKYRPL